MEMYKLVLSVWIYTILYFSAVYGLTCTCGNIQEGHDVECLCDTVNYIQWYKGDTRLNVCDGGTCIASPPGYTFSHTGSTYKITIEAFSSTNCKGYSAKDLTTQETAIFPYCPVLTMTKPTSGGTINIEEHTPFEFTCKMTSGSPAGTVEWYVDSGTSDVEITTNISSSSARSPTNNQEYITTSTLTLFPPRSYTGYRIYCKATNKTEQTALISTRKPQLNILYYSTGPIITEGSSYRVIENTSGQLSCVVTGGNPLPTVTWTCNGGTQNTVSTGETITRTVTWTARRHNSNQCTCIKSQTGLLTRTASTDVTVLYPPSAPMFKINGQTITGDIMLIENSTRQIRCVSTGSPDPTIVWEKPAGSSATSSGQVLSFTTVSKTTDHGTYTCRASNVMDPTGLPTLSRTNISSREIIVLFLTMTKPTSGGTINIEENTPFEFTCKMTSGYPPGTVEWYVDAGTPTSSADDVEITTNISSSSAQSPTDSQEYITTSTLTLFPPRSYTGYRIYCKATNKPEQTPLISRRKPLLNILYLSAVYGLTCTCGNIEDGQDVVCQCDTINAIAWYKGETRLTTCDGGTCTASPAGYTFSHTGSTYKITISTFSSTNCKGYSAKDLTTQETAIFPYCPGNWTWCFQCQDMYSLANCDTVTRCSSDSQICFIQRYNQSHTYLYRSGCMDKHKCSTGNTGVECLECCDGQFCNTHGCGNAGLDHFPARGPVCFDCAYQSDEQLCHTVQLCATNQVCSIETYIWGNGLSHTKKCANKNVCGSRTSTTGQSTRNAPLCSQCCSTDFCNNKCSSDNNPSIIG